MTQIPTWNGGHTNPTSGRAAPGTLIGGRYTLRAAVGHGGMGTVWRAADTLLRRDVAIKEVILPPGLAPSDRDSMYERTMREARAAAALQHPAVVQVYDVVHEAGRPWIVMELLDARSLADMVIEDGPVAPRVVAKIGIALLGALEVAHAHGVLHRDVKPANVLICSDGRCVLTDFGVARMPTDVQLTTPGMVLGSPHFISPERAMGQEFGPPSDLFSLGVTLYTAVEGRPPFDKGDPIETMHAIVEDAPTPPVRAGSLSDVLMGLLEKDPARRHDVPTARSILRQQLAGPLASKAPPHLMTDPYAVVPAQRPAAIPPPAPAPTPSGQIGGRAMLAPGESLTGRLARLREGGRRRAPEQPTAAASTAASATDTRVSPAVDQATGAYPPPPVTRAADDDATSALPRRQAWNGARAAREPLDAARTGQPALLGTVRQVGDRVVTTVRGWPRNTRLAAAGACAALLVLSGVLVFSGGDPANRSVATGGGRAPTAAPTPASFDTQVHNDRGVSVQVPQGWNRNAAGNWVDYSDPATERKVRILVEPSKGTPTSFLGVAEKGLKTRSTSCPKPYARVDLTETTLGGQPAGVLEYVCGIGPAARHGLWAAMVHNGKAYSFYLTTPEARFAESRPVFEEMARSFSLSAA